MGNSRRTKKNLGPDAAGILLIALSVSDRFSDDLSISIFRTNRS